MPTKRELQAELKTLRKELQENRALMRQAAAKAEDMISLRDQYEALRKEFLKLKRCKESNSN
jgi:hypothetical protein